MTFIDRDISLYRYIQIDTITAYSCVLHWCNIISYVFHCLNLILDIFFYQQYQDTGGIFCL